MRRFDGITMKLGWNVGHKKLERLPSLRKPANGV